MKGIMKLMGYNSKSQIADLRNVYSFEKKLAKIFLSSTMLRETEKVYKRVSINYLQRISPEVCTTTFRKLFSVYFDIQPTRWLDSLNILWHERIFNYLRLARKIFPHEILPEKSKFQFSIRARIIKCYLYCHEISSSADRRFVFNDNCCIF